MHKLMEYVCKEMEDLENKIKEKGGLSSTDMQYLDTLAHTKKNLLKAEEMSEGSYRGSYAEPMYADDERTENSRYSTRRDRMGRYSREDGYSRDEGMIEELRNMMGDLPANKQRELQQLIKRYER